MATEEYLTKSIKLSPDLAAIVGKKESSRIELMKLLWAYLKNNDLQCKDNGEYFVPDEVPFIYYVSAFSLGEGASTESFSAYFYYI